FLTEGVHRLVDTQQDLLDPVGLRSNTLEQSLHPVGVVPLGAQQDVVLDCQVVRLGVRVEEGADPQALPGRSSCNASWIIPGSEHAHRTDAAHDWKTSEGS